MKTLLVISSAFILLILSSCTSDSQNAADLFCENSKLSKDLQDAMDKNDEEKIIEISKEIHENNSELEDLFLKYNERDDAQEFYDEMFAGLESCESISKNQRERIKEYIKNPKKKRMPIKRVKKDE